jgi:hypothetical protein
MKHWRVNQSSRRCDHLGRRETESSETSTTANAAEFVSLPPFKAENRICPAKSDITRSPCMPGEAWGPRR